MSINGIISIFKKIDKDYIFLYILPLSLIFYATLAELYGVNNIIVRLLLSSRMAALVVISLVGVYHTNKYCKTYLSDQAFIFSNYCFIITLINNGISFELVSAIGTIYFWPLTLWIAEKSSFKQINYEVSVWIITIVCILMSYYTIIGHIIEFEYEDIDYATVVGRFNSIYLVLSVFPFIFLISDKKSQVCALILPILAFLISQKTTCLLAALSSVIYYYFSDIRHSSNMLKIIISLFVGAFVLLYFGKDIFDINVILFDVQDDFNTGGNGRSEQYTLLWEHYIQNDVLRIVFGSGIFAVARDTHLSAHNDFLEILYDYGITGFILFILFWKRLIQDRNTLPKGSNSRLVFNVSLIVYFCVCMASNFMIQQIPMLFFALMWGNIKKYSQGTIR